MLSSSPIPLITGLLLWRVLHEREVPCLTEFTGLWGWGGQRTRMSRLTSPGPGEPVQSILAGPNGEMSCLWVHRITEYFFQQRLPELEWDHSRLAGWKGRRGHSSSPRVPCSKGRELAMGRELRIILNVHLNWCVYWNTWLSQWLSGKESACRRYKRRRFNHLESEMATYSCILTWEIPWTEEAWWATVHGVTKAGHNWETENTHTLTHKDVIFGRTKDSNLAEGWLHSTANIVYLRRHWGLYTSWKVTSPFICLRDHIHSVGRNPPRQVHRLSSLGFFKGTQLKWKWVRSRTVSPEG